VQEETEAIDTWKPGYRVMGQQAWREKEKEKKVNEGDGNID